MLFKSDIKILQNLHHRNDRIREGLLFLLIFHNINIPLELTSYRGLKMWYISGKCIGYKRNGIVDIRRGLNSL
jgi:hypothetical protein